MPYLIPIPSRTLLDAIHILRLPHHLQRVTHRNVTTSLLQQQPPCSKGSKGSKGCMQQWPLGRWQKQLTVKARDLVGDKYRKGVAFV